jgi:mRNA-degrading endonuclease RelE of RelBE toxin-antitoxin system
MLYDEPKKKMHVAITPSALKRLDNLASQAEQSRSETLERLLRSTEPHEGLVLHDYNWLPQPIAPTTPLQ